MIRSMNVAWWVSRWAELHPRKPALIFQGRTYTYGDLNARAEACACWLYELDVEKGDRVAVLLDNRPEFIDLYLACARLGAIFVPLNFRLATPEIDYLLSDSRPRVLVFGDNLADTVLPLNLTTYKPPLHAVAVGEPVDHPGILHYDSELAALEAREPDRISYPEPTAGPEEPQVIMYTSGTTGHPKGAVLTFRKTFFNCLNANIFFQLTADDVMLIILPLFHSGGLFIQASPCLYQGGTLLLHPRFNPARVYADIERYRVTRFLGVPTVYRALLETPPEERGDLSSLSLCAIGGEKVTPELIAQCKEAGLWPRQIMGQTETSILLWASEQAGLERPGTLGRPVFHSEVRLVDGQGREVPPGEIGEIVVRGTILMKEYWHDLKKTEEVLQGGWLHTGDLARQDSDGYYYMVDRAKDMYISGGENVYPAEVERVLSRHREVLEAVVVGVPDSSWGETGHAFVIVKEGRSLTEDELIEHCRKNLAGYKVPGRITFRNDFPRTAMGKIRKFLLAQDRREEEG